MKKNLYYRTVFGRQNVLKRWLLNTFLSLTSHPRLLIEVFIRKDFGIRYFSLSSSLFVSFLLISVPIFWYRATTGFRGFFDEGYGYNDDKPSFWLQYATWYIFVGFFLYFSFQRWKEIKRLPSVFDFGHFSLSTGHLQPWFARLVDKIFGFIPNPRVMDIYCEPALPFAAGLILWLIGQKVGILLLLAALCYSFGYAGAYKNGDDFVMDKIDEMIMNEEMEDSFVQDESAENTRGVRFYTRKPNSEEMRRKVADSFIEEDEKEEATYAV